MSHHVVRLLETISSLPKDLKSENCDNMPHFSTERYPDQAFLPNLVPIHAKSISN